MFCTGDARLLCFSTSGRGHSTYFRATCSILHRPLPSSQRPITGLNGPWQRTPGKVWWITCFILHFPLPKRSPPRVYRKGQRPPKLLQLTSSISIGENPDTRVCIRDNGWHHTFYCCVILSSLPLDYRIRWDYISIRGRALL